MDNSYNRKHTCYDAKFCDCGKKKNPNAQSQVSNYQKHLNKKREEEFKQFLNTNFYEGKQQARKV